VGCRVARHRARDQNLGALKGFLNAYGETLPDIGNFNHNDAGLGGCEKPARATRSATV